MARPANRSEAEATAKLVAGAIDAGRKLHLQPVDLSGPRPAPDRRKTCLEVDFESQPINQITQINGNASKPIYQTSKSWTPTDHAPPIPHVSSPLNAA